MIFLFMTTHSDDDRGDLSISDDWAAAISDVSEEQRVEDIREADFPQYFPTVVTGDLLDFAKTVPFTIFLLCCGGVMMKEPRSLIIEEMKKYVQCFPI